MNYYPFHIGDFTAHTSHLTWEEDIAYRRMLDVYYLREKPLPIDVPAVARLVRMRDSLEAVEAVLTEFFVLQDDGWHQERCDQEIVSMREKQADSEARDEHEKNRMRRHRERRAEMFAWLRERGVVPAWDVSIKDLQRMCNEHGMTPETHLQREQEETCNAPATAIPTPTPTPTPKNKEEAQAPLPDWIPAEAWDGYAEMRKKIRKPMTARAQALVLKTLAGIRDRGFDVEAALDNSTRNGWIDVYEPKASAATAAGVKRGSEEYAALHRNASWWRDAGFESVWDAINAKCWHDNADKYRDGKRVEVPA